MWRWVRTLPACWTNRRSSEYSVAVSRTSLVVQLHHARGQVNFEAAGAKVAGLRARLGVALGDAKARQQFGVLKGLVT